MTGCDGQPEEDVRVLLRHVGHGENFSVLTDENGYFRILGEDGRTNIRVHAGIDAELAGGTNTSQQYLDAGAHYYTSSGTGHTVDTTYIWPNNLSADDCGDPLEGFERCEDHIQGLSGPHADRRHYSIYCGGDTDCEDWIRDNMETSSTNTSWNGHGEFNFRRLDCPAVRSCNITVNNYPTAAVNTGQNVTVDLVGNGNGAVSSENVRVWLSRDDGNDISNAEVSVNNASVAMDGPHTAPDGTKFYQLQNELCTSNSGVECTNQFQISFATENVYRVHCDVPGATVGDPPDMQCSGNPHSCDIGGSAVCLNAPGWRSCSSNDSAVIQTSAPQYDISGTVYERTADSNSCSVVAGDTPWNGGGSMYVQSTGGVQATVDGGNGAYSFSGANALSAGTHALTLYNYQPSVYSLACPVSGTRFPSANTSSGPVAGQDFFITLFQGPWWQTAGGDVLANNGDISSDIPPGATHGFLSRSVSSIDSGLFMSSSGVCKSWVW